MKKKPWIVLKSVLFAFFAFFATASFASSSGPGPDTSKVEPPLGYLDAKTTMPGDASTAGLIDIGNGDKSALGSGPDLAVIAFEIRYVAESGSVDYVIDLTRPSNDGLIGAGSGDSPAFIPGAIAELQPTPAVLEVTGLADIVATGSPALLAPQPATPSALS